MKQFVYEYITYNADGSVFHSEDLLTEGSLRGAIKYSNRRSFDEKAPPIPLKLINMNWC